jgi:membrane protease YdiL (CAAX protease family)
MPPEIQTPQLIAGLIASIILAAGIVADVFILSTLKKKKIDWKARLLQLQARPWNHFDGIYILLVLGTLFAALILSAQIMDQSGIVLSDNTQNIILLAETIIMHGITIAAIENLRRKHKLSYKACFSTPQLSLPSALKHALLLYIALIPPIIVIAAIVNGILTHFHIPIESQQILEMFSESTTPLWMRSTTILLAVVMAPIIEETIFRGIALPIAIKHTSPIMAIFATSAIFALIHGNLQAIAPLFILATGLSVAYIYTRSLIVPIAMHAIFNTASIILYIMLIQ